MWGRVPVVALNSARPPATFCEPCRVQNSPRIRERLSLCILDGKPVGLRNCMVFAPSGVSRQSLELVPNGKVGRCCHVYPHCFPGLSHVKIQAWIIGSGTSSTSSPIDLYPKGCEVERVPIKYHMKFRQIAVAVLVWAACMSNALAQASITDFEPAFGSPGELVRINGTGFNLGTLTVRFNGVRSLNAAATTPTMIYAEVPSGASSGPISVQIGSGVPVYSLRDFIVIGPGPYISGFTPPSGASGTRVYIDGAHFTTATNAYFDGKRGNNFFVQGDGRIQVDAPANVTTGKISVRSPLGNSTSEANFFVPPVITSFSPPRGRTGTNVLIRGTNFIGATAVTFGGSNASFTVLSNLAITAVVPPLARSGVVRVFTPADSFPTSSNFVVLPTIYGFSPGFGPPGTSVLITGANFTNLTAGNTVVRFNGAQANLSGLTFSSVTAVVPAAATTGPISITTSEGSHTNDVPFYVSAAVTSFTPTNSPPGSTVRITGNNFSGATAVSFGGVPAASFVVTNNTTIGAIVPVGVSTGPISVTTPAGTATSSSLFYGPPLITGFSPTHGLPGTNVFIQGTNFLGASAVRFAGVNATWFAATNNGFIYAAVPAGAQDGPISVVTPAGTNTSAAIFNLDYVDLAVGISFSPAYLFTGSNSVWVIGVTNYGPADSPDTRLTNTLPFGTFVVSAIASQGTLVTNTGSIVAHLGTLPAGASAHLIEELRFPSAGNITITASASSGYWETAPANNTTAVNAFVHPPALLNIQMLTNAAQITWPLSLSNLVLQHRFNLSPTNQWINNPGQRSTTSTRNVVTDTNIAAPQKFYRLRSP
jgi:hypothetical protein